MMGDVVLFRRLLSQARPYWPHVAAVFLLSLLSSPLSLLAPLPLKIAVDSVIGSHPLPHAIAPLVPEAITRFPGALLAFAIGLLVAVALLRQLQGLTNTLLQAYVKEKLVQNFRARLFRHVQRRSLAYHDATGTSDATYRIQHDATAIQYVLIESVIRRPTEGMKVQHRLACLEGSFNGLVGLATAAGIAAVLLIGVRHVRAGRLTLGELLLVMAYMNQLYEPLMTISPKAATLQLHLASAERAFALLDEPCDVEERPNSRPLGRASGAIAFRNVSFAYGKDRPVLHDISFNIQPGTRLGIAGAAGAGKSTLISLLMRFSDPTAGSILLDGKDLRDYCLADLRNQFAIVLQEPVLFSASIAENIAYAKPGATKDELIAAAQAANAHEFIMRFLQGYDTQVGERGAQLSGGQRQRIAIARAFLKDSPVLILDEPTSAVDQDAEAAIVEAIRRLMRGRTVILITHRPRLLERCTALIVLENGRVVADTTRAAAVIAPIAGPAAVRERQATLMSHPAVHAWRQLYPHSEPHRIAPLRVRQRKNKVYRLEGAGGAGTAVIAKRSRKADALIERTVYEEIFPRITVPSLRYYGSLEDADAEYCWLFLEDATGAKYSKLLAAERAQVARWLALLP